MKGTVFLGFNTIRNGKNSLVVGIQRFRELIVFCGSIYDLYVPFLFGHKYAPHMVCCIHTVYHMGSISVRSLKFSCLLISKKEEIGVLL